VIPGARLQPGPELFTENSELMWTLIASLCQAARSRSSALTGWRREHAGTAEED
jgi:hypothetical protein